MMRIPGINTMLQDWPPIDQELRQEIKALLKHCLLAVAILTLKDLYAS
jgi:hypothetical protein